MNATEQLTPRNRLVKNFIVKSLKEGRSPTIREIAEGTGISSPNGIVYHLEVLEKKGHITRTPDESRSIRIVGSCPCCGRDME